MYQQVNWAGAVAIRVHDGALVPDDPGNADYQAFQVWLAAGGELDAPPEAPPTSIAVSRLRLKLELTDRELLGNVVDAVTTAGGLALLYWNEATQFESGHALVGSIGAALSLSPTQIREIFEAARDREA